ncbi:MAG: response regulator transcription factor [Halioglobus sp.]
MFDGMHILVVDDDPEIRDAVGEYLELRRFKVSLAGNGDQMQQVLQETPIELILLDIGLPGTDGIELIRKIKPSFSGGIILLTGHGAPEDRVLGLESGADDYVVKPFNFRELLARIHSVLRRLQTSDESAPQETAHFVRFGNWTFDTEKRTLEGADGSCPELSPGELDILALLADRADTAVSRHEILEKTSHRDWNPLDRSIDVRITRLRKKLEQDATKPTLIRTARNVGYILVTTPPK